MKSTVRRNNSLYILIAAVAALAVLAAVLITGTVIINAESVERKNGLDNMYSSAFYDLSDSANNIEVNLSKLMIANGKKESVTVINDTTAQAELASSSLSRLPLAPENIEKTVKFYNQVGDWCRSYAAAILGGADTEAYREQAETLYIAARNINEGLKDISEKADGRTISECVGDGRLLAFDMNFTMGDIENNSVEYPELIYDGPFSDSKKYDFRALDGTEEIAPERAAEIAAEKVGLENVRFIGETSGKTQVYELRGTINGDDANASVTKKGGVIIGFDRTKAVGKVVLTREEASLKAAEYAARLGFNELQPVWYNAENGVGFVNLAPVVNEVTYYTDLVKVKVALDDGEILGAEATGYCSGHYDRDLKATISENTARSLVSPKITVEKVSLAVIPYKETERFCYEIYGSYKGLDYFVYIDAENGEQADVLRVIDSEQGSMIM